MIFNFQSTIFLLVFTFSFSFLHSQGENNIWNIGRFRAVDFNESPVELIETEGRLFTGGHNASISDAEGNLLFYSSGMNVWDSNHEIMPNGDFIANGGTGAPIMHTLILSVPNRKDQYYLFAFSGHLNLSLTYSIIDMNLNGGTGDVHPDFKDIPLHDNLTGILVAAKGVCGSLWVITHGLNNDQFFAHEINEGGIEQPIITTIGNVHTSVFSQMSFAPDSKKAAVTTRLDRTAELLEFNPTTGEFFNVLNLPIHRNTNITVNSCFSPDGSRLYIGESRGIFQYNLALSNSQDLIDSKIHIPTSTDNLSSYKMQRTPDEKIYITSRTAVFSALLFPNLGGLDCTYVDSILNRNDGVALNVQNLVVLPDAASQKDSLFLPQDIQLCQNTQLTLQIQAEGDRYLWQDGSTTKDYEITTPGTYWVEVQKGNCTFTDTLEIFPDDTFVDIGTDTTICAGESLLLTATSNNDQYRWQDGSTYPDFTVSEAGFYWVESTDSLCSHRDSIQIEVETVTIDLPADTTICPDQNLLLNVEQAGVNFRWQDGSTQPTFVTNEAGLYWVEAQKGACRVRDSITLTYAARPTFLPKDTTLCNAPNFLIYPNAPYKDVVWLETGNMIDSLLVTASGIYRALFFGKCQWEDSIKVDFQTAIIDLPADTIICAADELLLDVGTIDGELTWQDGSTDQQYLVTESGTYKASLTNENCTASDSIEVALAPLTLDLGQDRVLCEDESLALTIDVPNVNYEWQDGSNLSNFIITEPGVYWAKIGQDNCEAIDSITVNFTPSPIIDLGKDTTLCNGETLTLTAPNSIVTYEWQDGSQNPIFEVSNSDLYWLTGSVNNCSSRDSILVTFENCESPKSCEAYLPNSFSPNGDGINDELQLLTDCELQFFQMEVYDRWGSLMFSTDDVRQAWDGRYKGDLLDTGVYLWVVEYQFFGEERIFLKTETATIIR